MPRTSRFRHPDQDYWPYGRVQRSVSLLELPDPPALPYCLRWLRVFRRVLGRDGQFFESVLDTGMRFDKDCQHIRHASFLFDPKTVDYFENFPVETYACLFFAVVLLFLHREAKITYVTYVVNSVNMEDIVYIADIVGYNQHMPTGSPKKTEPILINLDPETFKVVLEVCKTEDRPKGYVARLLMLRGLALYRRDGKLRDEGLPSGVFMATLESPNQKDAAKPGKLVAHPSSKQEIQRTINDAEIAEIERRVKPKRKAR